MVAGHRDNVVDLHTTSEEFENIFHLTQDPAILRNMMQPAAATPRATTRGLSLLRAIADHPHGLPLADLAREVDLSASTALRQLRSLEAAGFATRRNDGCWEPGVDLLRLARGLAGSATLPRLAAPVLRSLAHETGESAYLAEPVDARTAIYVAMEAGRHAIRHVSWLGRTVPRRGTAVGMALGGRIDDDGAATQLDAVEPGVTALSAPVTAASGRIVAAVSVVGPSFRLTGTHRDNARSLVTDAAAQIASLLNES